MNYNRLSGVLKKERKKERRKFNASSGNSNCPFRQRQLLKRDGMNFTKVVHVLNYLDVKVVVKIEAVGVLIN